MRKIFEAELNRIRCEVPVVVTTRKELLDKYIYDPDCMDSDGIFYPSDFFIFVRRNLPYYQKLWILLHEYGHFLCWKDKCSCFRPLFQNKEETTYQHAVSEYHAHRYTLKYLRKKKYKRAENDCIYRIKSYRISVDEKEKKAFRIVHKKAVRARLIKGQFFL